MDKDESHFNVSLIVSHKTGSTNSNLFVEKGEPKQNQTQALLLTSLMPYHETKPAHTVVAVFFLFSYVLGVMQLRGLV